MYRRLVVTLKVDGTDKETRHSFEYRKQGEVEAEMDLTDVPHAFIVNRLVGLLEAVAIAADHTWPSTTPTDMTEDFDAADRMLAGEVPDVATSDEEVMAIVDATPVPLVDDLARPAPAIADDDPEPEVYPWDAPAAAPGSETVAETPLGDTTETAGEQDAGEREMEF